MVSLDHQTPFEKPVAFVNASGISGSAVKCHSCFSDMCQECTCQDSYSSRRFAFKENKQFVCVCRKWIDGRERFKRLSHEMSDAFMNLFHVFSCITFLQRVGCHDFNC